MNNYFHLKRFITIFFYPLRKRINFYLNYYILPREQSNLLLYTPILRVFTQESENTGWNHQNVAESEQKKWDEFVTYCKEPHPLGFSHEATGLSDNRNISYHNIHLTFCYVIGLVTQKNLNPSILDYGGGIGHYYQIACSFFPDMNVDYSIKEVPAMADLGKKINANINWFSDDTCLNRRYNLVMVNGSLQYILEWKIVLRKIIDATEEYLFLTRVPVVEHHRGFNAIQNVYGTTMIHQQFNQSELLGFIESNELLLIREFIIGDKPYIHNAPEQCELKGWLFKRK